MGVCGTCEFIPSAEILMQIIKAQTYIVKIGHEFDQVMYIITQKAQELTQCDGATIELHEENDMVYRAVSGSLEPFLGFKLSASSSLSGLSVRTGELLYCQDTEIDPRVDRTAAHKVGARSMVVVPLRFNDQSVGVLKVISSKPRFFDDHALCILSIMAETMGAAMYHAGHNSMEELFLKATTDAMTGVNNRASFYEKLRLQIQNLSDNPVSIAILIIDMDGLKTINDNFGHRAGDEAIKTLAERLRKSSRANDVVARLGGDEFGVVLPMIQSDNELEQIIERFRATISEPFYFENQHLAFDASIGFASYPDDANDLITLIDLADKRMYNDKKNRKKKVS